MFAAVALTAILAACTPQRSVQRTHPHTVTRTTATVYHFDDGRYGYRDDSGDWWFYYVLVNQQVQQAPPGPVGPTGSATLPSGGSWSKGTAPTDDEIEQAETATMEIAEVDGQLSSPEIAIEAESVPEAGVEAGAEAEGGFASSGTTDADTISSDDGGSSGGDSGGGFSDSGGGDSGGGDGGGGGDGA